MKEPIKVQNSARVRDNQRRSRERKRDHLESLEARIAAYEKDGVQANVILQEKARAIMQDNIILRKMLRRAGVSDDEVRTTLGNPSLLDEPATVVSKCCASTTSVQQPDTVASSSDMFATVVDLPLFADERFSLGPSILATPADLNSSPDDPDLLCNTVYFPSPTAEESSSKSFTSCKVAFDLLKTINGHRANRINIHDFALYWMWPGFRSPPSDPSACCVVENQVLFTAAAQLLAS